MNDTSHLLKTNFGEKVVFVLRRHMIVFLVEAVVILFLASVPFVAYFAIGALMPDLLVGPISRPLLILAASAYLIVVWHFLIEKFVDYYLDMWIVTTEKVLNIEQHGLFARTVSELDLSTVQDVTSEIKGIIPTLLNYGYVYIQTAGEKERFIFEQVSRPDKVRARLLELVEKDKKNLMSGK